MSEPIDNAVKDIPATHQLDKLPDLPPALPLMQEPIVWIALIFAGSLGLILLICGIYHMDGTVATASVGASGMLHTAATTALGADKFARKGIYAIAANKDGISNPS